MCIAAIIFSPVSEEYLKSMEKHNPDGGGVCWQVGDSIRFVKGLTAKDILAMQESGEMSYPYMLHFRWATHGADVPQLTHPFPIGPRALLGELVGYADSVLIHNGTWDGWEKHLPTQSTFPMELLAYQSDTAIAAWMAEDDPDILDQVPWCTAVAFMYAGEMDVKLRGDWTEKDGNWYSNLNWVPFAYSGSPYSRDMDWEVAWERNYGKGSWVSTEVATPAETWSKDYPSKKYYEGYEEKPEVKALSFEEYCRAKYGEETTAEVIGEAFENLLDDDFISEDPAEVNSYLARLMLKAG